MVENEVELVAEEIVNVEEVNNNVIDSIDDTRHTLNDEHRKIVERLKGLILEGKTSDRIMFKKIDKKTLKVQTDGVNEAIKYFKSKNITETIDLIKAASVWVAEQIGLKKKDYREKNEPRWKRRTEGDIKKLRQDVNLLTRDLKGELESKKKQKMKELYEKYTVKKKGLKTVIEEPKQRMLVKSAKLKRYEQRIEQFRQNRIFDLDQKKIYAELNGNGIRSNGVRNAEECTKFWGDIWGVRKEYNREAKWLKDLKRERVNKCPQERVSINVEKIRKQCRKIPNWKAPGRDGVQGYWIKNLSSLHERVSSQMNRILMGDDDLPEWMIHGHTVLCQKDSRKGNTADNYRPITCLPLMWKLLTGVIAEEMYNYLEREKILPE